MMNKNATVSELTAAIRDIPDFPKPGILFKDITPLLSDARLFNSAIDQLSTPHKSSHIDAVVGIDARGFIFAAATAVRLGAAFVPIRKKGKLPYKTIEESYELEYGSNTIAMHVDALKPGNRVLLVDDLLATGGTAAAAIRLLKKMNATIIEASFLVELGFLKGRERLTGTPVRSVIVF